MKEQPTEQLICPQCFKHAMQLQNDGYIKCNSCGSSIKLDTYLMSVQIIQKQIIIQALRRYIPLGSGKCIKYKGSTYIVGFTDTNDIVVQPHQITDESEIDSYFKIKQEIVQ